MHEHPLLIGDYQCPFKEHHYQDRPEASSTSSSGNQDGSDEKTALRVALENNGHGHGAGRKRKTKREKRKEKKEINQLKRLRLDPVSREADLKEGEEQKQPDETVTVPQKPTETPNDLDS